MVDTIDPEAALKMATDIVIAFLGTSSVPAEELPMLVRRVRVALLENLSATSLEQPVAASRSDGAPSRTLPEPAPASPAAQIVETVMPDWIVCLEDGGRFKSLRRHLKAKYNLTPEEYRRKWGLPEDYPMVAPNYSKVRSKLAKGLGFAANPSRVGLELAGASVKAR